jgi:hypothetical protein
MGFQSRGGIARVVTDDIDTTGRIWKFQALSMRLKIRAATFPVRLFFTEADFDAGTNFWEIGTSEDFSEAIEDSQVWLKGVGGTASVTVMVLHRKG